MGRTRNLFLLKLCSRRQPVNLSTLPYRFWKFGAKIFVLTNFTQLLSGTNSYHLLFTLPFKTGTAAGIRYGQNPVIWDKPAQKTGDKILVQKPVPDRKKRKERKKVILKTGESDTKPVNWKYCWCTTYYRTPQRQERWCRSDNDYMMHQPSSYFVDSLITPSFHGHSFPCSSSAPCNNHRHFRGSRTNCMVPSDWDLALKCICGPNFISIQVENSPVLSATSIFVFHWQHVCFYFYFVCLRICAYAFKSRVHCGSAFDPGASGLPYCCTWIYVRFWCDWRANCVDSKPKKKRPGPISLIV